MFLQQDYCEVTNITQCTLQHTHKRQQLCCPQCIKHTWVMSVPLCRPTDTHQEQGLVVPCSSSWGAGWNPN